MEACLQHSPVILIKQDGELADTLILEFTEHVALRENEILEDADGITLVLHEEAIECFLDLAGEDDLSDVVVMPGCEERVEVAIAHEVQGLVGLDAFFTSENGLAAQFLEGALLAHIFELDAHGCFLLTKHGQEVSDAAEVVQNIAFALVLRQTAELHHVDFFLLILVLFVRLLLAVEVRDRIAQLHRHHCLRLGPPLRERLATQVMHEAVEEALQSLVLVHHGAVKLRTVNEQAEEERLVVLLDERE